MSSEEFLACCKLHGFSLAEIEQLSFGFVIDTITQQNNLTSGQQKEKAVQASQADIDAVFR